MNPTRLNYFKKIAVVFFLFFFILSSSSFISNVIIEGQIIQFSGILVCLMLVPAVIMKPIRGLILLPIITYLLPPEIKFNGISLGLTMAAITIFSSLIYILSGKYKPSFPWLWVPIIFMIFIMIGHADNNYSKLLNFIQGITPFLIFCLVIKDEKEGRLILEYWVASFAIFAFFHILRGGILFSDTSILQGMASVRTKELGGYNPNVLGWMSLLYISITPSIALSSKNIESKKRWWFVFGGILLLIIFSFSRAAMTGLIFTLFLLFIFLGSAQKNYRKFFLPSIFSVLILFFIWKLSVETGVQPETRTISYASLSPEVGGRMAMIIGGWALILENPWGYGANVNYATHSAFTKAALDYGIPYFILFCLPYLYLIWKSYILSVRLADQNIKLILIGICVAGIVSIPQSIFGITLFSAGYGQVFWLFIGYVHLASRVSRNSLSQRTDFT